MCTGLFPNASRTSSKPSANRARLRTTSADGALSIPARAAISDAVSSSREKCAESSISTLHFSQFIFGVDQGGIERFARVILVRLSRSADDFGKSPAELFDSVPAAVRLRFHKGHRKVHDFETEIVVHLVSSSCRIRSARSVRF